MVDGFTVDGGRDSGRASEVAKGFFQVKHEPESDAPINMGESVADDLVDEVSPLSCPTGEVREVLSIGNCYRRSYFCTWPPQHGTNLVSEYAKQSLVPRTLFEASR